MELAEFGANFCRVDVYTPRGQNRGDSLIVRVLAALEHLTFVDDFLDYLRLGVMISVYSCVVNRCLLVLANFRNTNTQHIDIIDMVCSFFIIIMCSGQKVCELKIRMIRVSKSAQSFSLNNLCTYCSNLGSHCTE